MANLDFKTKILPHAVALAVFLVISVVFFGPIVFEGKQIQQNDVLQGRGAGQEINEYRANTGDEALWTNSMFGGMPSYLINVRWGTTPLLLIRDVFSLWLPSRPGVVFTAMLSFYILLLSFGVRPYLAIGGGISYGFTSFMMISIEAGHMWKVWAIAYMPLVIAGIHLVFRKKKILGFVLVAFGMALELMANHLQITYYLFITILVYGAFKLVYEAKEKQLQPYFKDVGIITAAVLLAVLTSTGRLWSVYEYGKFSTRGASELTTGTSANDAGLDRDYVFSWSHGKLETLTFLVPRFMGGASTSQLDFDSNVGQVMRRNNIPRVEINKQLNAVPTYWGDQPFVSGPVYAGVITLLLFVIGLFFVPVKQKQWLVTATILSIVLSWGKNLEFFNYLMYDFFPGYNKFRSVSMTLSIALLTIPLLGFLGLEHVIRGDYNSSELKKRLYWSGAIIGGALLLILLSSGMMSYRGQVDGNLPDWYLAALRDDRKAILISDTFRSLLFTGTAFILILFLKKKKLSLNLVLTLINLCILLDLWFVDRRYLNNENFVRSPEQSYFAESAADQIIKNNATPGYRVLNLINPWQEARTSYHHASIGGYHGAKIKRYNNLINYCLDNQYQQVINELQNGSNDFSKFNVINMLNTQYFKFGNGQNNVVPNPAAYGSAWLTKNVVKVNSPDEEISTVCNLTSKDSVVLNQSEFQGIENQYPGSGSITLADYNPNYRQYKFSSNSNELAVFSEIYYPRGWVAKIDNVEAEFIRVNFILRAMEIPSGDHIIEFEFNPRSYYTGQVLSEIASWILLTCIIVGLVYEFRKSKHQPEAASE